MTGEDRRAPQRRGPSTRWTRKELAVGAMCVALLASGAYAVLTHLGTPDFPLVHHVTASDNGGSPASPSPHGTPAAGRQPTTQGVEVAFAARVFDLWDRPGTRYQKWWAGLAPELSAQAAGELAGTDPRVLPAAHRTGEPTVVRRENGVFTRVAVATNLGRFDLDLVRRSPTAPWQLDRIGFPEDNR